MRAPGFIFTLALFSPGMALADKPAQLVSFLETYCVQCHGPEKQKGDRRFDKLSGDFSILNEAELFQEILDQLNLAEMPPKKAKQPPEAVTRKVVASLTGSLARARAVARENIGKVVLRRLNRADCLMMDLDQYWVK